MSAEPLDEIQWKSPEWIQQFGLHTGNVLDYFAESPFYDRTSNNQVLRMQFQFQQIPPGTHPQKYLQARLTEMVGTEFVVAFVREPDFWVVRKQHRVDPSSALTQHDYYIIGANVYQSPVIYDVLSARLLSSVLSVKNSVSLLNQMATYSISEGGHTYPSEAAESGTNGPASSGGKSQPSSGASGFVSTPTAVSNPGTAAQTTGASDTGSSGASGENAGGPSAEVSATAFESLLNNVVASGKSEKSIYIDDIPLYGKGSTVEQLGLQLNLNDDE